MEKSNSIDRLVELFLDLWGALPPHFICRAAKWGGLLWYAVDRRHRDVAKSNIRLALRYDSDKKIDGLAKANFIHLTTVFFETLGAARISSENCSEFVSVNGLEFLLQSLDKGKGIFTLTGHFGNWEWLAYVTPFFIKNRLNVIVRPLNSARFNRILTHLRERTGNRVIDKKRATGAIFRALENNEMIGVLLDQVSSRGEGVYAPFFGVYVLTNRALASLAIKTGSPVHPIFIRRDANGKYAIEVEPAINIPTSGSLRERILQATTLFNLSIERQIRADPSQWYWIHRRFKRHLRNLSDATEAERRPLVQNDE